MRKGKMAIVQLDMTKYLGRGIQVYLKDGRALNFKPLQLSHDPKQADPTDEWAGHDDEGNVRYIRRNEIEFVKGAK